MEPAMAFSGLKHEHVLQRAALKGGSREMDKGDKGI